MFKGEKIKGVDFYNLLFQSESFTNELGKVTLASGRLEAELMLLLKAKGIELSTQKPTLGTLVKECFEKQLIDGNIHTSLVGVNKLRNYITHNIYGLFSGALHESMLEKDNLLLEKNNLIDTDVLTYTDIAYQLCTNLNDLANIIATRRQINV